MNSEITLKAFNFEFSHGTMLAPFNLCMKLTFVGLFMLFLSSFAFATATSQQISRAQAVLKKYNLPQHLIRMSSANLQKHVKEVAYQDLRPRDILRLSVDVKSFYRLTGQPLVDSQFEGFSDTKGTTQLRKGEFVRVVQRVISTEVSVNPNFSINKGFNGASGSQIEVVHLTLVKLNQNFEPVGEIFYLIARGSLERKIAEFERIEGGFINRFPSLNFAHAGVNDLIVNAEAVNTGKEVIPAFSAAIVIKITRTRIPWTISNYDYVLRLHILNCPPHLRAQNCEVEIEGTKMFADPIWAHYTMPENRREIHVLGGTIIY